MKKKICTVDVGINGILQCSLVKIAFVLLLIISFLIRLHLAPVCVLSADYIDYIVPWVNQYRQLGFIGGLSQTIGNYYVPYNVLLAVISLFPWEPYVLVAFTSCLAEYISALFIYRILLLTMGTEVNKKRAAFIAVMTLYLPFVMLNGALWKQCDAIYVCFLIVSIYELLNRRYTLSFVLLSLGFCFKLQAVFIIPFYIIIYMAQTEFSILQFLWIPGMYLLTGLPAVLCGKGIKATYRVYFRQTSGYDGMTINAPNIYQFGLYDYPALSKVAVMATIAILIVSAVYVYAHRAKLDMKKAFYLAGWLIWTCFMFLPAMHERYDYAAILILTVVALAYRKSILWEAIVMNICSVITYSNSLFGGTGIPMTAVAVPYCAAYFAVAYDMKEYLSEE